MPTTKDEWALINSLKPIIQALTWADSTRIFKPTGVVISALQPTKLLIQKTTPLAQITRLGRRKDSQIPQLGDTTIGITVYMQGRRDQSGEIITMGDTREKGLEKLVRIVDLAMDELDRNTVPITQSGTLTDGITLNDGSSVVYTQMQYQARTSSEVEP